MTAVENGPKLPPYRGLKPSDRGSMPPARDIPPGESSDKPSNKPIVTVTPTSIEISGGTITGVRINKARGTFAARIENLKGQVFIIRGRFQSGDVKEAGEGAVQIDDVAKKAQEADAALDKIKEDDPEYTLAAQAVAEIHGYAADVAASSAGLIKPPREHPSDADRDNNKNIAFGAVKLVRGADVFRKSKHFTHVKESGLTGSGIADQLDQKITTASKTLVARFKDCGIEVDASLLALAGETSADELSTAADANAAPVTGQTAGYDIGYSGQEKSLQLVLDLLIASRERSKEIKEKMAEDKQELKEEERRDEIKRYEARINDISASLKQLANVQDPAEAAKIIKSLLSQIAAVQSQMSNQVLGLAEEKFATIKGTLDTLKNKLEALLPKD